MPKFIVGSEVYVMRQQHTPWLQPGTVHEINDRGMVVVFGGVLNSPIGIFTQEGKDWEGGTKTLHDRDDPGMQEQFKTQQELSQNLARCTELLNVASPEIVRAVVTLLEQTVKSPTDGA